MGRLMSKCANMKMKGENSIFKFADFQIFKLSFYGSSGFI
jgi:hypothetical protein